MIGKPLLFDGQWKEIIVWSYLILRIFGSNVAFLAFLLLCCGVEIET